MRKKKKKLLVGIHLDPMGVGVGTEFEETPEMEEQTIRRYFKEFLGDKLEFNFIRPGLTELFGKSLDVFVLDYGGMMPGSDGLIESTIRAVNKYMEEHPSCILLLWSQCTAEWFEAITEISILGDGVELDMPNVLVLKGSTVKEFWDKLRFMLCGEEKK